MRLFIAYLADCVHPLPVRTKLPPIWLLYQVAQRSNPPARFAVALLKSAADAPAAMPLTRCPSFPMEQSTSWSRRLNCTVLPCSECLVVVDTLCTHFLHLR